MSYGGIAVGIGALLAGGLSFMGSSKSSSAAKKAAAIAAASNSTGLGAMSNKYWKDELARTMGFQSGARQMTDDPEYKAKESEYLSMYGKMGNNLFSQLGKRGIYGGAAAGAMGNFDEAGKMNLLKMIQDMYSEANARGQVAANKGKVPNPAATPMQQPTQVPDMTGLFKMIAGMAQPNQISPNAGSGVPGIDYGAGGYGNWMPPSGSTWG